MARKKVELKYIANDSKRRVTQKKRKSGLIKKVDEISTFCGVDACAIIYSSDDPQPEVSSSPSGVNRVISRFKEMPELEQSKKMMSQESFLRQRIQKGQDQLKKLKNENRKKEMNNLMFQSLGGYQSLDNATMIDLNDLAWIIDQNINEVNKQMSKLQGQEGTSSNNNGVATINGEQAQVDNINGGHQQVLKKRLCLRHLFLPSPSQQVQTPCSYSLFLPPRTPVEELIV
ncbi:agamous-like MADS-box protein AGL80 [Arachis stenosperma]|uniref:agamous-like MADS-box protein AGL80 n=1 Tax=Arachis stenosperma TaxID=217475 RepID=UPI0025AC52E2|nr:agamous-like MADS-box protein AGL80 [Arachis stenosperma]